MIPKEEIVRPKRARVEVSYSPKKKVKKEAAPVAPVFRVPKPPKRAKKEFVLRAFIPAGRSSTRTGNAAVDKKKKEPGNGAISNLVAAKINHPIDEAAEEVEEVELVSEVVEMDCHPSSESPPPLSEASKSVEVMDIVVARDGRMRPLKITLAQTDDQYANLMESLPCPLFFMLVAELTIVCTPKYHRDAARRI
jgi:hypothetical protein